MSLDPIPSPFLWHKDNFLVVKSSLFYEHNYRLFGDDFSSFLGKEGKVQSFTDKSRIFFYGSESSLCLHFHAQRLDGYHDYLDILEIHSRGLFFTVLISSFFNDNSFWPIF